MTGRRISLIVIAVLAAAFTGVGLSRVQIDTGMTSFLPQGDPAYQALEDKARTFGGDPIIVILESEESRALLLDQDRLLRLLRLEGDLARLPDVAAVHGPASVLNQTAGAAQGMLAQISGRRDAIQKLAENKARQDGGSAAAVAAAGRAAVAAFDRRYGALLVQGLPAGLPTLRNPRFVETVMFDDQGHPRQQWHFVVPSATSVAVLVRPREGLDQEGASRLVSSVRSAVADSGLEPSRTTVTGVPVVTSALTDKARTELPLLGALSLLLVGLVYLLVPWTSRRRARIQPVFAALCGTAGTVAFFGWLSHDLSLGVVAFLPILLGIGSDFPFYLSRAGSVRPVLTAALAGVVGFASLALSPLPFVRELGLALALGIVLTVGIGWMLRLAFGALPTSEPVARVVPASPRGRLLVGGVAVVLASVGWVALPSLSIQAQPDELAQGLHELDDAEYAEALLGSAGEVSVVVSGADVADPAVLAWARAAETAIVRRHGGDLHPVLTLAELFGFLGNKATPEQVDAALEIMPRYLTSAVATSDRTKGLLIFGVEFDDVDELGILLDDVTASLPSPPPGVDVEVVGLPVTAVRGLDLVSEGRLWMNLAGILAAGVILMLGLRNWRDVVRPLLTVLLATGWVVCIVLATSGALSPLTVAIGSLTTATGCEFAVMMSRGRRGVATAALAGTVGYLVLGLSQLAVLRDFGLLLAAGVACSFAAALVATWLVPVLRSSPAPGPLSDQARPHQEVLS